MGFDACLPNPRLPIPTQVPGITHFCTPTRAFTFITGHCSPLSCCAQFMPGPGNDTMTIKRLLSRSWQFKNVVTTTRTFVAPKLPPPSRPFVLSKSGPAPLVQAIKDCSTFNVSCVSTPTTVHIPACMPWTLFWHLCRHWSLTGSAQLGAWC